MQTKHFFVNSVVLSKESYVNGFEDMLWTTSVARGYDCNIWGDKVDTIGVVEYKLPKKE